MLKRGSDMVEFHFVSSHREVDLKRLRMNAKGLVRKPHSQSGKERIKS